jgi:hypothetical protein
VIRPLVLSHFFAYEPEVADGVWVAFGLHRMFTVELLVAGLVGVPNASIGYGFNFRLKKSH